MSLRSRLVLVVLGLVTVGLAATNVVTYQALRSFLLDRVDQQLVSARQAYTTRFDPARDRTVTEVRLPAGSWAAIVDSRGVVRDSVSDLPPDNVPDLTGVDLTRDTTFSVDATKGPLEYRAQISPFGPDRDTRLLIAIPLQDVSQTLRRLVVIEVLASGIIVVAVGGLALVLVRAGLRPLEDIGEVAGSIAEGDLSQRVPLAESRTEVGRLGLSLNAMLGQIQAAFQARQASEARLRRFVADASHELRTPLTSIRGYAELFRRGAAERPADLAKAMRRIEEEASRMGVLVDDLLLLARLDQGRPLERAPVDLVRVAADSVDDARAAAPGRSISLQAPERLMIDGDEPRLRQVAGNLLANACQHTPADTPVVVRVSTDEGDAVLEVADQGPGLDEEAAQKVFERFYRADPSRTRSGSGSGLGLSIVAAIAGAHGGRVSVDSTPGAGACFRVTLPVAETPGVVEPNWGAHDAVAPTGAAATETAVTEEPDGAGDERTAPAAAETVSDTGTGSAADDAPSSSPWARPPAG